METVMDILRFKGFRPPVATTPAASVLEATRLMNDERIGSILVMHAGRLVGMFTERDVLRRVVAEMRRPEQTLVGEVMTEEVLCCDPETPIDEVAEVMRRQRVRHLPVVDGDGGLHPPPRVGQASVPVTKPPRVGQASVPVGGSACGASGLLSNLLGLSPIPRSPSRCPCPARVC